MLVADNGKGIWVTEEQREIRRKKRAIEYADVYGRFSEGFDTADLQDAKSLLESL
jgi:hypothetical protein